MEEEDVQASPRTGGMESRTNEAEAEVRERRRRGIVLIIVLLEGRRKWEEEGLGVGGPLSAEGGIYPPYWLRSAERPLG